jgi:hypothetical protein
MKKRVIKVLAIIVVMFAVAMVSGCFVTFDGPSGWDLDQGAQDAQFDFNHSMAPNPNK